MRMGNRKGFSIRIDAGRVAPVRSLMSHVVAISPVRRVGGLRRIAALLIVSMCAATPAFAQPAPPSQTTPSQTKPSQTAPSQTAPSSAAPSPAPAPSGKMSAGVRELGADQRLKGMSQAQQMDMVEFVAGNMLFVGFHELGHALIHELGLPVLGREEDAADSFAAIAMINIGTDFSTRVLVQAARGWFLTDRRDRKDGEKLEFYDEHGLDQQRAYQIVCFMVGWNEDKFKELADWVHMPPERQDSCAGDYSNAEYSWNTVLKPFRRAPDQPKSKIDIDYGKAKGKLEVYERSLRAIGYLETIAGYAAELIVWPRPISIVLQECGDSNAQWSPVSKSEILCYELADEFFELYRKYGADGRLAKATMNELLGKNIARLRALQSKSQQNLAADAGMNQNWVVRMENGEENVTISQLDKLAKALNVETAELFKREGAKAAQPATTPQPAAASKRSRK
jgi:DNA-binding XRE family transcriptional regulator